MLLSIFVASFVLTNYINRFNKLLKQNVKGVGLVKACHYVRFICENVKKYEAHFKFWGEILNETLKRGVECKKYTKCLSFVRNKVKIVQFN